MEPRVPRALDSMKAWSLSHWPVVTAAQPGGLGGGYTYMYILYIYILTQEPKGKNGAPVVPS